MWVGAQGPSRGFSLGGNGGGGGGISVGNSDGGAMNQGGGGGTDGISTTHSLGANFRNDFTGSHKGSVYGSYTFTRRMTDGLKDISQQNIFESGTLINNQTNTYYNQSNSNRFKPEL
jgi:hypothetical protein